MLPGLPAHIPDWLPISEAFKIAIVRFGNRQVANRELIRALQQGLIRNGGIMEDWSDKLAYRRIHLNTDDFMRWLNLKTGKPN
jgi:hypothetical protein